jgi:LAO/AO transport system kinase
MSLSQPRKNIAERLSLIENRAPATKAMLRKMFSKESFKKTLCFTGPAGVGKSSLIASLLKTRSAEKSLAWLACDPSSVVTKGSLLGDRIRLQGFDLPDNVFVRSVSTRSTQAFSPALRDMEVYLENLFDEVWIETAGAGQTQQEVTQIAGFTILVLQPETGDEIQWMKSGVRELADFFIVHKADLAGSDQMVQSLIENGAPKNRVIEVSSRERRGLRECLEHIDRARQVIDWKSRLHAVHLAHARDAFLEKRLRDFQREFREVQSRYLRNPY